MKFPEILLTTLGNFSRINNSFISDEGGTIRTISNARNITAVMDLPEGVILPNFCLYDLPQFLSITSLFDMNEAEVEIQEEKFATIKQGRKRIKYFLWRKDLLDFSKHLKPSTVYKKIDKFTASFDLTNDMLQEIKKASKIMKFDVFSMSLEDGEGTLSVFKKDEEKKNNHEVDVQGSGDGEISIFVENLKVLPGDYHCEIFSNAVLKMTHTEIPLFYLLLAKLK